MSVARGFGLNGKSYYTNVTKPQDINLQFTVTPTNGLGITSLKSNGYVRNVFMHTSTTPSANDGYTNPNPANGYALIQFTNNFNYYLNGYKQVQSPTTGSIKIDNTALTAGVAYVITTLGDASAATWQGVGLPLGLTPAVGVSFIATGTGGSANVSTSRVSTTLNSGIIGMEMVGNPGVMLSSTNLPSYGGAWALVQFLGLTVSGTISAPVFTGSALANHSHSLFLKNAAVADGATARVNAGTNLLGANTGSDITVAGGAATNGGIVNASAGTPAGTNSAPEFTSTSSIAPAAPTTGSIICVRFSYDASSVTIDGI